MKKALIFLTSILTIPFVVGCSNNNDNLPEWTVLNYLVASTNEEKSGTYSKLLNNFGKNVTPNKNVNWVLAAGGTTKWSTSYQTPGISFDVSKHQRYVYKSANLFEKVYETESKNMTDPSTLADFISWGVKNYPAKHYELVLHDHGGGAFYGFGLDTAYSNPGVPDSRVTLTLDNLESALKRANFKFDIIDFDACLMSQLVVAQSVCNYGKYLIANEENSASFANPTVDQMSYLYKNYNMDLLELAKGLTNINGEKSKKSGMKAKTANALTDLSKVPAITTCFNNLWKKVRANFNNVDLQKSVTNAFYQCDRMIENQNKDLLSFLNKLSDVSTLKDEVSALKSAINEAVILKNLGSGHASAGGLSFYFDNNFTSYKYDHLTRGETHNLEYIAYIDGITPWWNANDSLYENIERYEASLNALNSITFEEDFSEFDTKNIASIRITNGLNSAYRVDGAFYKKDSKNNWYYLGKDVNVNFDYKTGIGTAKKLDYWTYICLYNKTGLKDKSIATLDVTGSTNNETLYSIPVEVSVSGYGALRRTNAEIITTFNNQSLEYEIHGICAYDSDYDKVPGGEYMPWPTPYVDEGDIKTLYYALNSVYKKEKLSSANFGKMFSYDAENSIYFEEKPLDPGTYGYAFVVTDLFGHEITHSIINEYAIA